MPSYKGVVDESLLLPSNLEGGREKKISSLLARREKKKLPSLERVSHCARRGKKGGEESPSHDYEKKKGGKFTSIRVLQVASGTQGKKKKEGEGGGGADTSSS